MLSKILKGISSRIDSVATVIDGIPTKDKPSAIEAVKKSVGSAFQECHQVIQKETQALRSAETKMVISKGIQTLHIIPISIGSAAGKVAKSVSGVTSAVTSDIRKGFITEYSK